MIDVFIGADIEDISRINSSLNNYGERFKSKIFTNKEKKYCESKSYPPMHYAGRFCAKEAVLKAIRSSGLKRHVQLNQIEILADKNTGPNVNLLFKAPGKCKVSISHNKTHAIAFAVYYS